MLKTIITHAQQSLQTCFDPAAVEQTARSTEFVQRQSKLGGFVFLKALVLGWLGDPHASLNQLCGVCADLQVTITPQGLDERLNEGAVAFLQQRLADALLHWRHQRPWLGEVLQDFSEVYLMDSTTLPLSPALHDLFPGSGGRASRAALKIQLLFGLLGGNLTHLALVAGKEPDSGYQAHLPELQPGSLLLQDLGYFRLGLFEAVAAQEAFFLTRWRSDAKVYLASEPDQALDMLTFLAAQTKPAASYAVQVGQTARLACRMIVVRLPKAVAEQRRRRVKADARRRGTPVQARSLALCDWHIFLTNVPEARLSIPQLLACYGLRWQVELIFKLWKSQAGLDRLAALRQARALCEVYAKLIGIVLTHFLLAPLRFRLMEERVEISPVKARQILADRAKDLILVLGVDPAALADQLQELCERILRLARKNKRKTRLSSFERLFQANQLTLAQLYPPLA